MSRTLARRAPLALLMLAFAGLGVSGYLGAAHLGDQPIECAGLGSCDYVNSSDYAHIGPVPVSLLGVGMYLALAGVAGAWILRPQAEALHLLYWGLAVAGVAYAAYLTYVELAVLHAICVWCVVSACILTLGLVISTLALLTSPETANLARRPTERAPLWRR